jgi:hypothetical protein
LFSDTGRTTLALVDGPVTGITDLSGNGRHLQTPTGNILRRAGGYLDFPGPPFIGFAPAAASQVGSLQGWTAAAAVRPDATLPLCRWMDASPALPDNRAVAQAIVTTTSTYAVTYVVTATQKAQAGTIPLVGNANVVLVNISTATTLTLRVNKVQDAQLTFAGTLAQFANGFFGVGAAWTENTTQNQGPVKGRMYAAFWINRPLTPAETTGLEAWMSAKAGLP